MQFGAACPGPDEGSGWRRQSFWGVPSVGAREGS